jgi:hypothetical protein
LAIVFLLFEFFQILLVDTIRVRHIFLVPPVIAGLVAAQEKNRGAAWIENIQNAVWTTPMLHAQLAQRGMAGSIYLARMRKREIWALLE